MAQGSTEKGTVSRWGGVLVPHPASDNGSIQSIGVSVERTGSKLSLHYEVVGDIAQIALPSSDEPRRADGLWEHTCFEAFLGAHDVYYEFNFSPSRAWAFYRFSSYRTERTSPSIASPPIKSVSTETRYNLYTDISLDAAPLERAPKLGLTAVIKSLAGDTSYWALAHGDGPPDFHHASCFIGQIP